jgi:hypothetical protein
MFGYGIRIHKKIFILIKSHKLRALKSAHTPGKLTLDIFESELLHRPLVQPSSLEIRNKPLAILNREIEEPKVTRSNDYHAPMIEGFLGI